MANLKSIIGISLLGIAMTFASAAFAQSTSPNGSDENAPSASTSMHRAGESTENAVSHTYHAAKRAVKDTAITSRVKVALHDDKITHGADIHVDTIDGVVTLSGDAPTAEAARRAVTLARETRGVEQVKDAITVTSERSSMR